MEKYFGVFKSIFLTNTDNWKIDTVRLLVKLRRLFDERFYPKTLRKILFMITYDFDKLKVLSKYWKYFSLKNNEVERPRKISQNEIKFDINIFWDKY